MNIITHSEFEDIKIIDVPSSQDTRGNFIKIYNEKLYYGMDIDMEIKESFYSFSNKNVIRGLHFQVPPYAHDKLVHVVQGSVIDVIVDLRKQSRHYKKFISIELSAKNPQVIYIPLGFAHGFKSLEDNTVMLYNVSTGYSKVCDSGIKWDSIGFDWGIDKPIISERDNTFIELEAFDSPF